MTNTLNIGCLFFIFSYYIQQEVVINRIIGCIKINNIFHIKKVFLIGH